MAYKWIIGDFATGNISENNELPVVLNKSDKITTDVNADETATITVSMNDLPSDWRTYLSPVNKMVAYIDTDAVWSSAVVWAGFINKVSASVNDTVKIQAVGLKEYMKVRSTNNIFASTNTNPKATVDFNGSNYQSLMGRIIQSCFSTTGISTSHPRPPQVLISVATSTASGTGATYSVPVNDAEFYANILDTLRDDLSDAGQEYWFVPQWRSSSKTQIGWVAYVGSTSIPHRQENTTLTVNLGDGNNNTYKPTAFGQTASSDNMVSRIIGISKEGDDKNPSDLTTKTTRTYTNILIDEFWNPGVELTNSQLNTQLSERLSYNSQTFKESNFTTVFDDKSYIKTHSLNIGKMATFTSSGNVQNFGLTMRVVGVSVSFGGNTAEIELAPKAARYPRLPKDGRNLKPRTEAPKTGRPKTGPGGTITGPGGRGGPGDYVNPITPTPKPGYNGTTPIPGGGGLSEEQIKDLIEANTPPTPPPFSNPKDTYNDTESIIETVDKRWFKTGKQLADEDNNTNLSDYFHPYPSPVASASRFNNNTGEYIGLNMTQQWLYTINSARTAAPEEIMYPVKIYSMNVENLFDRDENPYKNVNYNNRNSFPGDTAADKTLVGEIPFSMYSDVVIPAADVMAEVPAASTTGGGSYQTPLRGKFQYIFFCSEDLKTVYVQIIFNISTMFKEDGFAPSGKPNQVWGATLSKVIKGTRNENGVITSWESLGQALTKDNGDVFVSTNIYQINGEYHAFGGYSLPQAEDGTILNVVGITNEKIRPHYAVKYYDSNFYKINPESGWSGEEIPHIFDSKSNEATSDLPGFYSSYKIPYSVKVDRQNKKIILGITDSSKNSIYYEADFSNYDFKKILETNRHTGVSTINLTTTGITYGYYNNEYTAYGSIPIIYKDNKILLIPQGIDRTLIGKNITGQINIGSLNNLIDRNTEKAIDYLRSKKGYQDVVSGSYAQPNKTGGGVSRNMDEALPLIGHMIDKSNLIAPYSDMFNISSYNHPSGGMDYFIKDGFLYVIFDAYQAVPQRADAALYDNNLIYWIGKFKFKDGLL